MVEEGQAIGERSEKLTSPAAVTHPAPPLPHKNTFVVILLISPHGVLSSCEPLVGGRPAEPVGHRQVLLNSTAATVHHTARKKSERGTEVKSNYLGNCFILLC